MTSGWYPFLLIRPCGLPFTDVICAGLHAAGLRNDGQYRVRSWREVSRRLYFDQYGEPGTEWRLQAGAEAWLETTVALYGDTALSLTFGRNADAHQQLAIARRLSDVKHAFRLRRRAERSRISVTYTGSQARWPIYFDGIHVPEPDPPRIRWEARLVESYCLSIEGPRISDIPSSRGASDG